MMQYRVTHCGAAVEVAYCDAAVQGYTLWCSVQEPWLWCCSKGHTTWCYSTNISYLKHFNINTVLHFCPPLVLTRDILTTVFAMQLGSYRHNVRYTCSFQLSKWHYVEEHNNPEWRLRWWRNVWYNRQDAFDNVWTSTATSTYYLSEKHFTRPYRVRILSKISVPNAQTWHLSICRVIYLRWNISPVLKTRNLIQQQILSGWIKVQTTYNGQFHAQFRAFNHPQHVALVPNEDNRLHKHDPQKVSCQWIQGVS